MAVFAVFDGLILVFDCIFLGGSYEKSILLALALVFSLGVYACDNDNDDDKVKEKQRISVDSVTVLPCVNVMANPKHCGACNNVCEAEHSCISGVCVKGEGEDPVHECADGMLYCNGICYSRNNKLNCGECGNVCADGYTCDGRACIKDSFDPNENGDCGLGAALCDGKCIDVHNDVNHCGACETKCDDGEICRYGTCTEIEGSPACNGFGEIMCGEKCINTNFTTNHCGECNNACDDGEVCVMGLCQELGNVECGIGAGMCDGRCVAIHSDDDNCGSCGTKCAEFQKCMYGVCVNDDDIFDGECKYRENKCGNDCVDLMIDSKNCSACGLACSEGEKCNQGMCVKIDDNTVVDCSSEPGTSLCGNECVNLKSNPVYCGSCNGGCGAGQVCTNGKCVSP